MNRRATKQGSLADRLEGRLSKLVRNDMRAGRAPDRSICIWWTPEFEALYLSLHRLAKAAHEVRKLKGNTKHVMVADIMVRATGAAFNTCSLNLNKEKRKALKKRAGKVA